MAPTMGRALVALLMATSTRLAQGLVGEGAVSVARARRVAPLCAAAPPVQVAAADDPLVKLANRTAPSSTVAPRPSPSRSTSRGRSSTYRLATSRIGLRETRMVKEPQLEFWRSPARFWGHDRSRAWPQRQMSAIISCTARRDVTSADRRTGNEPSARLLRHPSSPP